MRDRFRREAAAQPQVYTGERLTGAIGGQAAIEHYHRYLFARAFCRDRDVLDVACGEGYGAAQIAQVARHVIGVDRDPETVAHARQSFPRQTLSFVQSDAHALPLAGATCDVVVSFETIEHFDRQDVFLDEVRRVLRPGGLVIISTPDRDIYATLSPEPNAFHVREFSRTEFTTALRARFAHVAILPQRAIHGSVIIADTGIAVGAAVAPLVFDRGGADDFEASRGMPRAPYLIALASDQPLPDIPVSLYVDRDDLDSERLALHRHRAALEATRTLADDALRQLDEAHARLREADQAARQITETARRAVDEAAQLRLDLARVRGSFRLFLRGYLPRLRRYLFPGSGSFTDP